MPTRQVPRNFARSGRIGSTLPFHVLFVEFLKNTAEPNKAAERAPKLAHRRKRPMAQYKRTALYDFHIALGARMIPFGGWEMPIQYSGISKEHQAVRQDVGIFDVSHMGEFFVRGPRARCPTPIEAFRPLSTIEPVRPCSRSPRSGRRVRRRHRQRGPAGWRRAGPGVGGPRCPPGRSLRRREGGFHRWERSRRGAAHGR